MDTSEVTISVPETFYTLFNTSRGELPAVVVANRSLLTFQHHDIFPWHLRITVHAIHLAERGMPSPEEGQHLLQIGDRLESCVLSGGTSRGGVNALFLSRCTCNAALEIEFLAHDPAVADLALKTALATESWDREWKYLMQYDPEWNAAGYAFALFKSERHADA